MKESKKEQLFEHLLDIETLCGFLINSLINANKNSCEEYVAHRIKNKAKKAQELL